MTLLRKFLSLQRAERQLLIKVVPLLGAIRAGLWLFPFRKVHQLVGLFSNVPVRTPAVDPAYRDQVVRVVRAVSRRMLRDRPCLTQALAVQLLLRRKGYPAELRIGVKKGADNLLLAHAWIESEGKVVIGGASSPARYAPFPPIKFVELRGPLQERSMR